MPHTLLAAGMENLQLRCGVNGRNSSNKTLTGTREFDGKSGLGAVFEGKPSIGAT
jgi:hypothetical protein